jgi:hypothetical protein
VWQSPNESVRSPRRVVAPVSAPAGDTVSIPNHGELVAQGAIEELLTGSEGIAYSVSMECDFECAYQRVFSRNWVSGIQQQRRSGATTWAFSVTDTEAAKALLLRLLLADEHIAVTGLGRKAYKLEEL